MTSTMTASMISMSASRQDCPTGSTATAATGRLEDVTEKAGVGVLDNTACALFADFENKGRQDLLVVCGSGPLLFLNQGDGTFSLKRDAFKFEQSSAGNVHPCGYRRLRWRRPSRYLLLPV